MNLQGLRIERLAFLISISRYRFLLLTILTLVLLPRDLNGGISDWLYFEKGVEEFGGALYARHPGIQIGPFALAVAALIPNVAVARVCTALLAPLGVFLIERVALREARDATLVAICTMVGGMAVVKTWSAVTSAAHIDDGLALVLVCGALAAAARDRWALTGAALALSILAKPWALVALPIVAALSRPWMGLGLAVGLTGLGWGPFLLADRGTLAAASYGIRIADESGLRVLGLTDRVAPGWVRPLQLGVGLSLTTATALRRLWLAVPLVGFAARAALDAGAHSYYDAGLVIGAFIWDQAVGRTGLPTWTMLAFLIHQDVWAYLVTSYQRGVLLLIFFAAVLAVTAWRSQGGASRDHVLRTDLGAAGLYR